MSNKKNIQALLDYLQTMGGDTFRYDEAAIANSYKEDNEEQSLVIKILTVFGGTLASLAFLGFIVIARLYESGTGLLIFGSIFIAGSILLKKGFDKLIIDTISVSAFIIGFLLLTFGMTEMDINKNTICIILILISLISLIIVQSYVLSFVAILIINGSIFTLFLSNHATAFIPFLVAAYVLILSLIFLKESKIITTANALSKLYNPLRIALVIVFILSLEMLGQQTWVFISVRYLWASSVAIFASIIYVAFLVTEILKIERLQDKIIICILTAIALSPTALSPAVSGAVLIILLSFLVNYKTGLAIGILAFMYFISRFYYDLNLTLLVKSLLLFSSGIVFLLLYLFTYKKLSSDEKI